MTAAVKQNWEYAVANDYSFRDACLVNSMNKIHKHLEESGIVL